MPYIDNNNDDDNDNNTNVCKAHHISNQTKLFSLCEMQKHFSVLVGSIRLSVRHTRHTRLNGSRFRNVFCTVR